MSYPLIVEAAPLLVHAWGGLSYLIPTDFSSARITVQCQAGFFGVLVSGGFSVHWQFKINAFVLSV